MRRKIAIGTAAAIVLAIAFCAYCLSRPKNQFQHTYQDGTILCLQGTIFGTNHVFAVTTPWERLTKSLAKAWDNLTGSRVKKPATLTINTTAATNTVGMLGELLRQPGARLGCYFEIENPPAALTNKKWCSIQSAQVLDAGGCIYKGFIHAKKRQPKETKQAVFVGFHRYPAHQKEFELRLFTSQSTNALCFSIKNLAYQSVQPEALPVSKKVGMAGVVLDTIILCTNADGRQEWMPKLQMSLDSPPGWRLFKPEIYSAYQQPGDWFPPCPHEPVCLVKATAVTNLLQLGAVKTPTAGEVLDLSVDAMRANLGLSRLYLLGKGTYAISNGRIMNASPQTPSSQEMRERQPDKQQDKGWNTMILYEAPSLMFSPSNWPLTYLERRAFYVDERGLPRSSQYHPNPSRWVDSIRDPVVPSGREQDQCPMVQISSSEQREVEFFVKNPLHGKD